jgi:copper chaperone CopZ
MACSAELPPWDELGVMKRPCLRYVGMKQPTHSPATVQITTLEIAGMSCDGCARQVTKALNALEGVHASVDLQEGQAVVEHLPVYSDASTLVTAVRNAGYSARVASTVDDAECAPSQSAPTRGCGCGCGPLPRLEGSFDLGTSTIG